MDKKLTSAVYAAVEKAYDHQCDIEDAADEILEIIKADRQARCEPVGYIMPTALRQLIAGGHAVVGAANQGGDVPLYTAPQPAEPVKRKRRYAQGTALGEFGVIPMCDQVDDEPPKVPSDDLAHEIWAAAQTAPGEGIEDAVERVAALLARYGQQGRP